MWRTWFSLLCRLSSKTSDHPCAGDDHAGVLAQGAADEAHVQGAAFACVSVVPLTQLTLVVVCRRCVQCWRRCQSQSAALVLVQDQELVQVAAAVVSLRGRDAPPGFAHPLHRMLL